MTLLLKIAHVRRHWLGVARTARHQHWWWRCQTCATVSQRAVICNICFLFYHLPICSFGTVGRGDEGGDERGTSMGAYGTVVDNLVRALSHSYHSSPEVGYIFLKDLLSTCVRVEECRSSL